MQVSNSVDDRSGQQGNLRDGQSASRTPSRYIIRGGAIAKTSGRFAAVGARCGCTTMREASGGGSQGTDSSIAGRISCPCVDARPSSRDLQDASRTGNASEVTRLCHVVAETASGMAQSSELPSMVTNFTRMGQ